MTKQMTEAQMVGLVRNALLVAGYEMGQTGDHWPVINDTIHSIAKDWEESKIQRDVDAEMKTHLYQQLGIMEFELATASKEARAEMGPIVKEIRDICDAYFVEYHEHMADPIRDEEVPEYLKRVEVILETLGGKHA